MQKSFRGFGTCPNKFLRNASEPSFSISVCVSTHTLLIKFVLPFVSKLEIFIFRKIGICENGSVQIHLQCLL